MKSGGDKWVRCFTEPASPRLRVFCLPYAGGGTVQYRQWARALPPDLQLCGLALPGREARIGEPSFSQIEPLIAALAEAITPWLDRPFVLYGHSMGALLSFELARALRARLGVEPARLIVSGRAAPDRKQETALRLLPDDQFVAALSQRYGGIPQVLLLEPELLALFLPPLRADFAAIETYQYQASAPLQCPITAVCGTNDRAIPHDAVHSWQRFTRGSFSAYLVEGEHFFIQTNPERWLQLWSAELRQTADSLR